MRRQQGGDTGGVAVGEDFDDIGPDNVRAFAQPQQGQGLGAGEAAATWRAGARRESRIDAVDVE